MKESLNESVSSTPQPSSRYQSPTQQPISSKSNQSELISAPPENIQTINSQNDSQGDYSMVTVDEFTEEVSESETNKQQNLNCLGTTIQ